ncbi:eukaryotic peptide chain release factor GTP-binding subunit ERF3A-like isoform X2 [Paramacrobiotus metropolitanus]|uniref:eukaryotic peptide chain release factor GTP-binding subunit ERF3A-like isoform X2 n=1 Tax=Paramacrobiotus metropolitanus TaxID=2943436 RepID=UPI0024463512|nr:eukaryotic peptide chain release factor GTP-binding subunit ERF3A-like isoform X2 [Paramacrobiotus metropolitanus]
MAGNEIPESWDDGADEVVAPVTSAFSKFNVHAAEFVPNFSSAPQQAPVPAAVDIPLETPAAVPAQKKIPEKSGGAEAKKTAEMRKENSQPQPLISQSVKKDIDVSEPYADYEDMEIDEPVSESRARPVDEGPKKEHLNIVFIGHVDAGKSTIGGHVLLETGTVDKRTLEKYEREAKEAGRESWFYAYVLDTNPEERDKGKTVEVGRAVFETEKKLFTILDAPGHKSFVANMLEGASQADIAILVISARKGEFETGFEKGGQSREHALLAKTSGVKHLVVLINKMDDTTVNWSEERYNECRDKLSPYLKQVGFNLKTDVFFMPVSGFTGANLKEPVGKTVCPWYSGPSFLDYLDNLPPFPRNIEGPLRIPIIGRFREMGTVVTGKIESGSVKKGDQLLLMPNRISVEVLQVWADETEVTVAACGDNVRVKLRGVEEDDVQAGFILCDSANPCKTGSEFDAQVAIYEHKNIICAGYKAIMHLHALQEAVTVKKLIALVDKRTGKPDKENLEHQFPRLRCVKAGQLAIIRFECADGIVCMENWKDFPQLSRFTLRDEGKTIGFGKIVKIGDKN